MLMIINKDTASMIDQFHTAAIHLTFSLFVYFFETN